GPGTAVRGRVEDGRLQRRGDGPEARLLPPLRQTHGEVDPRDLGEGGGGMSEQAPLPDDALPLPSKLRLHQACRDFEPSWRGGQVPEIARFLPEAPPAERLAFARELILLDLEYRRSGGYPCLAEDYLARFPELDRTWLLAAGAGSAEADGRTVDFAGGS